MLNKKALAAAVGVPGQYQIERSLRFNSADSAYLSRTPASAGNRKTFTFSVWTKFSAFGSRQIMFGTGDTNLDNSFEIEHYNDDKIRVINYVSTTQLDLRTTAVYRDPSAWYHIVVAVDTTQATNTNRVKLYVNGTQVTSFSTATYPTQNLDTALNTTSAVGIGRAGTYNDLYFNGYMTEVNFIDGQALTPSDFGETDADTGIWKPKAFSGTYGTNGFYLDFSDNSGTTSTTLGKDYSGNSNNWTPNNFSVTAGTGNDSLVDTPTPYGTDTGAGGEVRGNYATLNPLRQVGANTVSNGNLDVTLASGFPKSIVGTIGLSSGKWYWEVTHNGSSSTNALLVGVIGSSVSQSAMDINGTGAVGYYSNNGNKYVDGSASSYGASFTTNDVIGVALDLDSGTKTITFYKNNSSQGSINMPSSDSVWNPAVSNNTSSGTQSAIFNFGQRPFSYTAPSGYKALCTTNLPTPTIGATATTRADDYFNTVLYTATGGTQSITGVGFQPDLVWAKSRSNSTNHGLIDAVRGVSRWLGSNTTDAEDFSSGNYLTAFNSDGFTVAGGGNVFGATNYTYVAWNWKANGAGSSNTAGTISSTVSANTTAGFSIVTYTGNGSAGATVGHGLGATPSLIIVKARSVAGEYWMTYHTSLGNTKAIFLQRTDAESTSSTYWNNTSPTSTLFSLGTNASGNGNGTTYVAYCFAPIAGFSAFGSYTGNGSTDGPFVYTGFRPAFILVRSTSASRRWQLFDDARFPVNGPDMPTLTAEQSAAESTTTENAGDFLSNGFKCRATNGNWNGSGETYIYMAFADNPFKYSLAR